MRAANLLQTCKPTPVCYAASNMLCDMILNRKWCCRFQLVRRIGTVGSAVAVHWHSRLNQIFVGTGDSACSCPLTIVF